MEKCCKEPRERSMVKCCKRCVGTFNVAHKIYECRCYEVVKICPCCHHEYDSRSHRHCPRCGLNIYKHIQGAMHGGMHDGMHGGYSGREMPDYRYGKEIDPPEYDPEEDFDM